MDVIYPRDIAAGKVTHLHDGRPEVHRLESDGAVPHALEPADLLLRRLGVGGGALEPAAGLLAELRAEGAGAREGIPGLGGGELLAEQRPRGAEDVGGGGHFGCVVGMCSP